MSILNITNGDCTVAIMQEADLPGIYLPWRDVLHVGPVPGNLSLDTLSSIRSDFILTQGWGNPGKVKSAFRERDALLKNYHQFNKVILWFEHDLYDQLQILQILDWFYRNLPLQSELTLICHDQYLGMLTPEAITALSSDEVSVDERMLFLAHQAWSAFCSDTPEAWCALMQEETVQFPFLQAAVLRILEEYPSCFNGLSKTETTALKIIQQGESHAEKVFAQYQEREERKFMGDTLFWKLLEKMTGGDAPLLELPPHETLTLPSSPTQKLKLTQHGHAVLSGEKNRLEISETDHWIGGVHLQKGNVWCWDGKRVQRYT